MLKWWKFNAEIVGLGSLKLNAECGKSLKLRNIKWGFAVEC
jgi:hypothetical protein